MSDGFWQLCTLDGCILETSEKGQNVSSYERTAGIEIEIPQFSVKSMLSVSDTIPMLIRFRSVRW
ncbi:protein of unknown function (plasmid) [Cupriavidus taiwanensis]|uniref:Uncharacterized protein n=1 Tax=Cupriavidus taiwanensis TaxID=164546 RepID=A0A375IN96_9BURK|nr:hypothetical protein CT19425_U350085 [Cupriavidus taiwanensis]SPK74922.1 protein of unknown function [Cupriavidus taiwanensis]